MELNGVINFYKEKGQTSFKAVHQLKKILSVQKIGHTGTLDPLAQGVLPVCFGKATRSSMYIMDSIKEYLCTMKLGFETDTLDLEGIMTKQMEKKKFEEMQINQCLESFVGYSEQQPPIYSAIKVNGKKLYQYARNNQPVDIKSRKIFIENIKLEAVNDDILTFKVTCEKGTYIRSLCRDIGYRLGTYGTMIDLIRLKTGKFFIENSYKLEDIKRHVENGTILQIIENPDGYMKLDIIRLNDEESASYLSGVKVKTDKKQGDYLIKNSENDTVGIGIVDYDHRLKSKKRLI